MADEEEESSRSFWTTLPGIRTGITGIVSALTAFYVAVFGGARPPHGDAARPAVVEAAPEKANAAAKSAAAPDRLVAAPGPNDVFVLTAVIDDPDGFTNIRSGKSASSAVLARVTRHEQFSTFRQDGEWWQVRTRDGTIGYMHASRIRVIAQR